MCVKGQTLSKVTVHSTICGFKHTIEGKRAGHNIIIDIVTPCEKIKKMSHMEIPNKDIWDIKDNYVMNQAQSLKCSSNCLVPLGVIHVCRIEAGLLAESLCKQVGSVSITFE
jgi:hypothetical protein